MGFRLLLNLDLIEPAAIADGEYKMPDGSILHIRNQRLHRDDGPAMVSTMAASSGTGMASFIVTALLPLSWQMVRKSGSVTAGITVRMAPQ